MTKATDYWLGHLADCTCDMCLRYRALAFPCDAKCGDRHYDKVTDALYTREFDGTWSVSHDFKASSLPRDVLVLGPVESGFIVARTPTDEEAVGYLIGTPDDRPAKLPAGDTGRHVEHDFQRLRFVGETVCSRCGAIQGNGQEFAACKPEPLVDVEAIVRAEEKWPEYMRLEPVLWTINADPPTWSRHETPAPSPDSLIFNPVTREFE